MSERVIKMIIQYDGTNYYGWQRQSEYRSVQGEIERVLKKIFKTTITIDGAGRTDAGVHAYGQVATFSYDIPMPLENLKRALNNNLSEDVFIKEISFEDLDFHARYSAIGKTYIYKVQNSKEKEVFLSNYTYNFPYELDDSIIISASKYLIGEHDFRSFMASGSSITNTIRTISEIKIIREGDLLSFSFTGNGFLYKMVRILVGLLLEIGNKRLPEDIILEIFKNDNRKFTSKVAPSNGLYLEEVYYC